MKISKVLGLAGICLLSAACGGGGSNGSDAIVFEGELTQGGSTEHAERRLKHGAGEPIENVKICALGRCSTTDSEGNYGFIAPSDFKGGDVLFEVEGHGILASTVVSVPDSAKDVFVHFETSAKTEVHVHELLIDGVAVEG